METIKIKELLEKPNPTGFTIGGSEVGMLAGLSQYGDAYSLYEKKVNGTKIEENDYMIIGRYLEDAIVEIMQYKGNKISDRQRKFSSPRYRATIDGILNDDYLLEIKSSRKYIDGTNINNEHICQVIWYMGLAKYLEGKEFKGGKLVFMDASLLLREFDVEYDDELFQQLLVIADNFFENNLIPETPPPMSPSNIKTIESTDEIKVAPAEYNEIIDEYNNIAAMIKKLELKQDMLKNQIISYISEAGGMITDKYKVTYKTQTRESLDTKAIKEECEDIYNKYKKISTFRVMRISKNK